MRKRNSVLWSVEKPSCGHAPGMAQVGDVEFEDVGRGTNHVIFGSSGLLQPTAVFPREGGRFYNL